jgi:hypothetical protein
MRNCMFDIMWDFWFSLWQLWISESSLIYCRVVKLMSISIWLRGSMSQNTVNFIVDIVCCYGIRSYCDSTNIIFLLPQAASSFATHYQFLNIYNSSTIHWILTVFFCSSSHLFHSDNRFNRLKQTLLYNLYCMRVYLTVNKLLV